jgi:hypothetical protein
LWRWKWKELLWSELCKCINFTVIKNSLKPCWPK